MAQVPGDEGRAQFRERARPPTTVVLIGFMLTASLAAVLPGGSGRWWEPLAVAGVAVVVVFGLVLLVVIEVDDQGVSLHRRRGGATIRHEQILAHALLTGRALRAVRERNLPSFRVHCPIWERRGVLLLADTGKGPREYLVAVRDLEAFRTALGVTRWELETDRPEQLPN